MLLRNVNERLQIINRKSCKNELTYNQKLFKIRLEYMQKYKSVILLGSKPEGRSGSKPEERSGSKPEGRSGSKPEERSGSKPEGRSGSKEPLDSEKNP